MAVTPSSTILSRRTAIATSFAMLSTMPAIALAAQSVEASAPSIEDQIASLIAQFENHGYSITATMREGKCVGIYTQNPRSSATIDPDEFLSMHEGYRDLSRKHDTEFVAYLINTGRLS